MLRKLIIITCFINYFNANAQFGNGQIIAANSSSDAERLLAADVNGDGLNDVIGYSAGDDQIFCYENLGNHQYGVKKVVFENLSSCTGLSAGDMDGDGDRDIVYSGWFSTLGWIENTGNANFTTNHFVTELLDAVFEPQVADLDADGKADIFFTAFTGKMGWFKNLGNGTFANISYILQGNPSHIHAELSDQDGDGFLDVVYGIQGDHGVLWMKNDGSGNFVNEQLLAIVYSVNDVVCGDLDNDGDRDVVASRNSELYIFENQGDGSIDTLQILAPALLGLGSLDLTDINDDGLLDILGVAEYKIHLFKNNAGDFSAIQVLNDKQCDKALAAQMDSDNREDLICNYGGVCVIKNNSGVFDSVKFLNTILNNNSYTVLKLADMDQDGTRDVVSEMGTFSWFSNAGSGNFSQQKIIDNRVGGAIALALDDLDNDGDLDAVGGRESPDYETIAFLNDGTGHFNEIFIDSSEELIYSIELEDMNGDGLSDFVSLVYSLDNSSALVLLYKNNGAGTFQRSELESLGQVFISQLALKDLDGDGLTDISFTNGTSVKWIRNLGSGNFASVTNVNGLPDASAFQVIDFDLDGDHDFVLVNDYQSVEWYENNGSGQFSMHPVETAGSVLYRTIHSNDFDQDGDLDIIAAKEQSGELTYWKNLANAGFAPAQTIQLLDGFFAATTITSADLYGSDKPELVCDAGNRILVLENLTDLGLDETEMDESFCYPNPVKDHLYIDYASGKYDITVRSVTGTPMLEAAAQSKQYMDLSDLSQGTYIVSLLDRASGKIIKQKILKL